MCLTTTGKYISWKKTHSKHTKKLFYCGATPGALILADCRPLCTRSKEQCFNKFYFHPMYNTHRQFCLVLWTAILFKHVSLSCSTRSSRLKKSKLFWFFLSPQTSALLFVWECAHVARGVSLFHLSQWTYEREYLKLKIMQNLVKNQEYFSGLFLDIMKKTQA